MSSPLPPASPQAGAAPDQGDVEALEQARSRLGRSVAGTWHLDSVLGAGGMAHVYAATNRQGQRAAIKILHPELTLVPGIRDRFLREAHVSRQVNHPGCVAFIDEGQTEQGEPYLAMELLAGQTLEALCQERGGRIPVPKALRIARAVIDVLCAFHAQSIVHRDIKPGNIFLTADGRVKLLDLGVAQLRETGRDATRPGLAVGTPAYMSPEQAMGRRHLVDGRSDIYSLGATLHLVLSGVRLHPGVSEDEALVRAATQPAASLARVAPELPIEVIALVDKALQWDRRNRFQSAAEMRDAVDRLLVAPELELELDLPPRAVPAAAPIAAARGPRPDAERELGRSILATPEPADQAVDLGELDLDSLPLELDTPAWLEEDHAVLPSGTAPPRTDLTPTPSGDQAELELESLPPPRGAPMLPFGLGPRPHASEPGPTEAIGLGGDRSSQTSGRSVSQAAADGARPLGVLFECIDRLLRTARQYGPAHPATQSRIEPVHQAILAALQADPSQVHWRVLPFCFMHDEAVVWEPAPPGDLVPYTLSVAGLREVRILPGVGEEEIRDLFGAMMVDATSDPVDVAATLWEAPFTKIECRLEEDLPHEDAAVLDDLGAAFEDLQRELQRELEADPSMAQSLARSMTRGDLAEAAAMATGIEAARDSAAAALALEPDTKAALGADLPLPSGELGARHVEVLLEAWADAMARRDVSILTSTLAAFARRLIRTGRHEELFNTHAALLDRIARPAESWHRPWPAAQLLTAALFPDDVLRHVVQMVTVWSNLLTPEHVELAHAGLGRITRTLGPGALPRCLGIIRDTPDGSALDLLIDYVIRVAVGQEQTVVAELESLRPLVAQRLLAALAGIAGSASRALIEPLLSSSSSVVRCEAIALLSPSSEQLCAELMKLFSSEAEEARRAALDTFVRHRVVSAGPALVRVVQHDSFSERPLDEQRAVLAALYALNPRRTESLLVSILGRHGLIPDAALDETRMVALTLLGERAKSRELLDAVLGAARRRPWNTARLRDVAVSAAHAIEQRLGTGEPSGEAAP